MDIGKPQRVIIVEPLAVPAPIEEPAPSPPAEPVEAPAPR